MGKRQNKNLKVEQIAVLNCQPVYQSSSRMTHTIWPWNGLLSNWRNFQTVKVLNDDSGWFPFHRTVLAHLGLCEAPPGLSPNLTINMTLIQWVWMLSPQRKPFLIWLPTPASCRHQHTHTHLAGVDAPAGVCGQGWQGSLCGGEPPFLWGKTTEGWSHFFPFLIVWGDCGKHKATNSGFAFY